MNLQKACISSFLCLGKIELDIALYEDLTKLFQGQNNKQNDFLSVLLEHL